MYDKILVPHAGTPAGDLALKHAIHIAKSSSSEIILLHVIEDSPHVSTWALHASQAAKIKREMANVTKEMKLIMEKVVYDGGFPGNEFYEPFGQVTYWERQEIKTTLTTEGKYYVIVLDEKNQAGKYSLALGTIEDFSGADLFTILPTAWLETKLFVGDYASVAIFVLILIAILAIPTIIVIRRKLTRTKTSISKSG